MKYKVGEIVKHKKFGKGKIIFIENSNDIGVEFEKEDDGLHDCGGKGQEFHCWWCCEEDLKKVVVKKTKNEEYTEQLIDNVITKFTETVKQRDEEFNKTLEKSLNAIDKTVNQRTIYDEIIQQQVLEKAKELSLEDLEETIKKNVDKYIKKEYGMLPKKVVIENELEKKEITGIFHEKFEEILKIVEKGVPLMLTGPAGAGKNYTLEQIAKALGLDFYFSNAITQEYKLTGFIDAGGTYQETQFYKAFKDGGLFFLDEIDASVPEALIILNSAIANGYFDFPNERIDVHPNFRVVCAGNTFGTGADMVYVGRNALDGATLDRFAVIEFDYDEKVEKQLSYDNELFEFIKDLRKAIKDSSLRYIVSMRATINATKLTEIGLSKREVLKSVIIKNMQPDDLNVIIKNMNSENDWYKELEKINA